MILNINSTRGQTRFLTCVARVTCLVLLILRFLLCSHAVELTPPTHPPSIQTFILETHHWHGQNIQIILTNNF